MPFVKSLHCYPIKSCRGVAVEQAALDGYGFVGDRRMMVVDNTDQLVTAREVPRMVLITVQRSGGTVTVSAPGRRDHMFTISDHGAIRRVRVWDDWVDAVDTGDAPAMWFSDVLGFPVRLVTTGSNFRRSIHPKYNPGGRHVHFGDAYPLLLISTASLADLNTRLEAPLPMTRFRPNVVIEGCDPYEEDRWKTIRVGDVVFKIVKPCSRCVLTTVDPETGEKGKEPLRTLSQYRRAADGNVYFGQNVIHESHGVIRVGDRVEIMEGSKE